MVVITSANNYFPTPLALVEQLVAGLAIRPGDVLLEPSAGQGNIADYLRHRFPDNELRVVELDNTLRRELLRKHHNLVGRDFLDYHQRADVIIGNPPFCNDFQDVLHFLHAWGLIRPGGQIGFIMHEFSLFPRLGTGRPAQLKLLLDRIEARRELLGPGAFLGSERSTNTSIAMVWATKPQLAGRLAYLRDRSVSASLSARTPARRSGGQQPESVETYSYQWRPSD